MRTRTAAQSGNVMPTRQRTSGKQSTEVTAEVTVCSRGSVAKESRGRGGASNLPAPACGSDCRTEPLSRDRR